VLHRATSPRGSGGRMRPALSTPLNAKAAMAHPSVHGYGRHFSSRPVAGLESKLITGGACAGLESNSVEKKRRSEPNMEGGEEQDAREAGGHHPPWGCWI
jgi:hypothetical protein